MPITIAFDVYGTLIDTHGIVSVLQTMMGTKAKYFSQTWREKQLEYSFRRGLMQNYENFAVCTKHALDYTCLYCQIELTEEQKDKLLQSYKTLPAFDDVQDALVCLKKEKYNLYAFSNGSEDAIETLLENAGIRYLFQGVVSVDDLKSFKPNPAVYSHFLRKSHSSGSNAWLISSNSFDVIGAISAGMKAAWVRRSKESIFDPWGIEPTIIVEDLSTLNKELKTFIEPVPTA